LEIFYSLFADLIHDEGLPETVEVVYGRVVARALGLDVEVLTFKVFGIAFYLLDFGDYVCFDFGDVVIELGVL
jgi:hypothetical protein